MLTPRDVEILAAMGAVPEGEWRSAKEIAQMIRHTGPITNMYGPIHKLTKLDLLERRVLERGGYEWRRTAKGYDKESAVAVTTKKPVKKLAKKPTKKKKTPPVKQVISKKTVKKKPSAKLPKHKGVIDSFNEGEKKKAPEMGDYCLTYLFRGRYVYTEGTEEVVSEAYVDLYKNREVKNLQFWRRVVPEIIYEVVSVKL